MSRALDRALLQYEAMPDVGGDPIVESGSNTDGEWVRWADGTQQCSYIDGVVGTSTTVSNKTWTYPLGFVDIPAVYGSVKWSNTASRIVSFATPTMTACVYACRDEVGSPIGPIANLLSIGYWK